jgi:hypothetical protein
MGPNTRQSVVAAAVMEMGVPPYLWTRVQECVRFAEELGATPTRETIVAAIESLGPQIKRPEPSPPPQPKPAPKPPPATAVVYYLRFGDRVKIGTTTNLARRLSAIPHDEVLATEVGSFTLERERHGQFAADRVIGEWFHMSPSLMEHIEGLTCP